MTLQVISDEVKAKLRLLLEARDLVDELDAQLSTAKKDLDEVEMDVFEMFASTDDEGEPAVSGTISVPLGEPYGTVKFRTRETHYAKIIDKELLMEHYENRGLVDDVMTEPKFVMKRINGDVREIIDTNGKLPPGVTYRTDRGMTITRQK